MYKKILTYTDFDGNERTETFRFNLTKAELTSMYNSIEGGLEKKLQTIIDKKDIPKIMENFEYLIDRSYGEMSPDGRKFVKNAEVLESFKSTQAYSDIYMLLMSDETEATAFVNGILPENLRKEVMEEVAKPALIQG